MNTTKVLNIDSLYRRNYFTTNSTDFKLDLNYPIINVVSMKLSNIQLPNTWHNVAADYGNNTFTISGDTFIIPDGNYNSQSAPIKFKYLTSPNPSAFSASTYLFDDHFELTLSTETGKSTINNKNGDIFDLKFSEKNDIDSLIHSLAWMLGFRKAEYSGSSSYESEAIFNSNPFSYIYLVIDDNNYTGNELIIGNLRNSVISGNILAIIRVNSSNYGIINTDSYETQTRVYSHPVRMRKLHIKLLSPEGQVIDLNNMDFSFSLEFEIKNDLLI